MQDRQGSVSSMVEARAKTVAEERERRLCKTLARGGFGLRRKVFDPASFEDRLQYARFLTQGRWSEGRAFECEAPYLSVPETVRQKLLAHFLRSELEIAREPQGARQADKVERRVINFRTNLHAGLDPSRETAGVGLDEKSGPSEPERA